VVWPKGQPQLKENDIIVAAIAVGLVDNKVVSFSETHSALRLVIPSLRPRLAREGLQSRAKTARMAPSSARQRATIRANFL
jgi:hypothetical protein